MRDVAIDFSAGMPRGLVAWKAFEYDPAAESAEAEFEAVKFQNVHQSPCVVSVEVSPYICFTANRQCLRLLVFESQAAYDEFHRPPTAEEIREQRQLLKEIEEEEERSRRLRLKRPGLPCPA